MINCALLQSFVPIVLATAQPLRAHSLVHQKMSLLRFQFPRGQGGRARDGLCRCLIARSGRGYSALSHHPATPQHFCRRRHAEPVFAGSLRPSVERHCRTDPMGRRYRDHARSESRHFRKREIRRVSRARHQPPVDRHPEFRRHLSTGAGPGAFGARGAARGRHRAKVRLRQSEPGFDVRLAGREQGQRRQRYSHRDQAESDAYFVLSADAGAEYLFL